jgi:hypothetical protein
VSNSFPDGRNIVKSLCEVSTQTCCPGVPDVVINDLQAAVHSLRAMLSVN